MRRSGVGGGGRDRLAVAGRRVATAVALHGRSVVQCRAPKSSVLRQTYKPSPP